MRVIILAAGNSFSMDGIVKGLIVNPLTNKTFLDQTLDSFSNCKPTVVVGYRAVDIMQRYPNLNYIYNPDWSTTSNSYSLGLALNDEPCYVVSSDIIISKQLMEKINNSCYDNAVVTSLRENRILTALHCIREDNKIKEIYVGTIRNSNDPEAVGIFKVSSHKILKLWKKLCLKHRNLFVGQNLPLNIEDNIVNDIDIGNCFLNEINTPLDYIHLLETYRGEKNEY